MCAPACARASSAVARGVRVLCASRPLFGVRSDCTKHRTCYFQSRLTIQTQSVTREAAPMGCGAAHDDRTAPRSAAALSATPSARGTTTRVPAEPFGPAPPRRLRTSERNVRDRRRAWPLSGEQREQRAATRMPESDQVSAGSLSAGLRWAVGQSAAGRWSATGSARPKGAAKGRASAPTVTLCPFFPLRISTVVSGRCGVERFHYTFRPSYDPLRRLRHDPDRLTMGTRCLALVWGTTRIYPTRNPT